MCKRRGRTRCFNEVKKNAKRRGERKKEHLLSDDGHYKSATPLNSLDIINLHMHTRFIKMHEALLTDAHHVLMYLPLLYLNSQLELLIRAFGIY